MNSRRLQTHLAPISRRVIEDDRARRAGIDSRVWRPAIFPLAMVSGPRAARGSLNDVRRLTGSVVDLLEDARRHVWTRGFVSSDRFGHSLDQVHSYQATPWVIGRALLAGMRVDPGSVFIDYGCGKGRMLMLALERGFARVLGIEVIPELAAVAGRNTLRFGTRCEVIVGNAGEVRLPDDTTVIYAFNPFGSDTWGSAADRIRELVARKAHPVTVVAFGVPDASLSRLEPYDALGHPDSRVRVLQIQ